MATFHAGNGGTATVNSVELAVKGWSVDPSVEVARFRNSKTAGYTVKETTWKEATFSIDVDWDFDLNPFAALGLGSTVTNVKLFLRAAGQFWLFPSAIVVSEPQSLEVNGEIVTRINLENSGTFTAPV